MSSVSLTPPYTPRLVVYPRRSSTGAVLSHEGQPLLENTKPDQCLTSLFSHYYSLSKALPFSILQRVSELKDVTKPWVISYTSYTNINK